MDIKQLGYYLYFCRKKAVYKQVVDCSSTVMVLKFKEVVYKQVLGLQFQGGYLIITSSKNIK